MKQKLFKVAILVIAIAITLSITLVAFAAQGWKGSEKTTIVDVEGGIKVNGEIAGYTAKAFNNEVLEFDATLELATEKTWSAFMIRQADISSPFWDKGSTAYTVVFKQSKVEFQKWVNSSQKVFKDKENTFWKPGETHKVTFSAVQEGEAVRVIFKVDGKEVWNELDSNKPITEPGYFGVMAFNDEDKVPSAVTITNFKTVDLKEPSVPNTTGNPKTSDFGVGGLIILGVAGLSGLITFKRKKSV